MIKIVTDSSALIDQNEAQNLGIRIVPLTVIIDGKTYVDGVDLNGKEFMSKMSSSDSFPTTSQPSIGAFKEVYDEIGQEGDEILSLHMTSALSGTVHAAEQAAQLTDTKVSVIDTKCVDQSLAYLVRIAVGMSQEDKSLSEIESEVRRVANKSQIYLGVSILDNLVKGGRVPKAVGAVSNFIKLRLVFQLTDKKLELKAKGRGNKTFVKWLKKQGEVFTTQNVKEVFISHTGNLELVQQAVDILKTFKPDAKYVVKHTSPIVCTHVGKDAFAVLYHYE
ncbi:DegV family protein [Pediococcus argentinicus]|uniref:DegV family protein n=1 Tax=Pediococcus argentinicus TaxID=480391 RepID=A0A0R2NFB2_9LACO|nr:DegV family protein [Pediococcus argentinicus]KRO22944.1 degV family protein [Pediococcus argentinicus]NKZ22961.1 DegV family protein [Pediococcus argentinicus]GEP20046.1 hypothetical protein LSA03_14300 [Pediococcus argentinicus]